MDISNITIYSGNNKINIFLRELINHNEELGLEGKNYNGFLKDDDIFDYVINTINIEGTAKFCLKNVKYSLFLRKSLGLFRMLSAVY